MTHRTTRTNHTDAPAAQEPPNLTMNPAPDTMTPVKKTKKWAKRKITFTPDVTNENAQPAPSPPVSPPVSREQFRAILADISNLQADDTMTEEITISDHADTSNLTLTNQVMMDVMEPPQNLHQLPIDVHAITFPLNFGQSKRVSIAHDLRTDSVSICFRGDGGTTKGFLRVSKTEMETLMKEHVYRDILSIFSSPTHEIDVGGIHISFSDNKITFLPTIRLERKTDGFSRAIELNRGSWEQLGELREGIKLAITLVSKDKNIICGFTNQFIQECVDYFKSTNVTLSNLKDMNYLLLVSTMKKAFEETSGFFLEMQSQWDFLNTRVDFELLRQELKSVNFGYMKNAVMKAMSE